jgi:hypothetical protein
MAPSVCCGCPGDNREELANCRRGLTECSPVEILKVRTAPILWVRASRQVSRKQCSLALTEKMALM